MRYRVDVSYDGKNYYGFQKQANQKTIAECLELTFTQVLGEDISIVASGRTDAGVSAMCQVCHIDTTKEIEKNIVGYVNHILPEDIRVLNICKVDENFHARFSPKSKTYEYWFYIGQFKNPIFDRVATYIGYNINVENMKTACVDLIGEHDFSSFCASNTSVVDKVRTIFNADIIKIDGNLYKFIITGNGFLYNMVRIIMGTLVDVGLGKIDCNALKDIIKQKDRSKAGKTMCSGGLYLKKVEY